MGAKNQVIAGDKAILSIGLFNTIPLTKANVTEYEVLDESSRKSAASAVGRAAVGAFFLGPIGLAAGLSAKSKGVHTVAIQFVDGKKSLLEVDDKIYKAIMTQLF